MRFWWASLFCYPSLALPPNRALKRSAKSRRARLARPYAFLRLLRPGCLAAVIWLGLTAFGVVRTLLVGLIGAVVALLYPSSPTGSRWAGSGLRGGPLIERGSLWPRG